MATTLICVETREVVRCDFCSLVQYRPPTQCAENVAGPLISRSRPLTPQLVSMPTVAASAEAGLQVAAQVREIRRARHLSQRQLASRMQVPRTYISKIENGKAIPTLGSLERLADALEVDMRQLVRDSRSRRDEEVSAILSDPFLAEIASMLPHLDSLHRTLLYGSVAIWLRDGARTGLAGRCPPFVSSSLRPFGADDIVLLPGRPAASSRRLQSVHLRPGPVLGGGSDCARLEGVARIPRPSGFFLCRH